MMLSYVMHLLLFRASSMDLDRSTCSPDAFAEERSCLLQRLIDHDADKLFKVNNAGTTRGTRRMITKTAVVSPTEAATIDIRQHSQAMAAPKETSNKAYKIAYNPNESAVDNMVIVVSGDALNNDDLESNDDMYELTSTEQIRVRGFSEPKDDPETL